mmetsp:Transcript_38175/g.51787  ORF Transcript_38175/g.51787 Transcript_38175/m.51787 type:complete len:111 (-) Transcript_38175:1448-1780(-)
MSGLPICSKAFNKYCKKFLKKVFYEGMFSEGKLNGQGTLKMQGKDTDDELINRIYMGTFVNDQFTGPGKVIDSWICRGKDLMKPFVTIGEFKEGKPHGLCITRDNTAFDK